MNGISFCIISYSVYAVCHSWRAPKKESLGQRGNEGYCVNRLFVFPLSLSLSFPSPLAISICKIHTGIRHSKAIKQTTKNETNMLHGVPSFLCTGFGTRSSHSFCRYFCVGISLAEQVLGHHCWMPGCLARLFDLNLNWQKDCSLFVLSGTQPPLGGEFWLSSALACSSWCLRFHVFYASHRGAL